MVVLLAPLAAPWTLAEKMLQGAMAGSLAVGRVWHAALWMTRWGELMWAVQGGGQGEGEAGVEAAVGAQQPAQWEGGPASLRAAGQQVAWVVEGK